MEVNDIASLIVCSRKVLKGTDYLFKKKTAIVIYVVVQFYPWFKFYFPLF